jgi:Cu-Zn family superoxide dismutase
MDSKILVRCAGLLGAGALFAGCSPDTGDTGAAQSRPGDSALSRNESGQPPGAGGDAAVRPPTTSANPAAPGSAAAPGVDAPPAATPRLMARADVRPLADSTVRGVVEFQAPAANDGPMTIHVMLMGLAAGPHGLHVHEGTDCAAPGEHLNPLNSPHGPANAAAGMRHLGDLGNVTADASGMVEETLRESLLSGDASFIGKVVVVHEGQDDLSTQPDGSAGEPIACGAIEAAGEDVISRGDAPSTGV